MLSVRIKVAFFFASVRLIPRPAPTFRAVTFFLFLNSEIFLINANSFRMCVFEKFKTRENLKQNFRLQKHSILASILVFFLVQLSYT